ncbi:MAG: hypothetical protein OET42_00090, partial [Deltaproteobacteria bacterium]|nr:hypothetical protein [Deltaproteobacteria bacterium]
AALCLLPALLQSAIYNLACIYLRLRWRKIAEKGGTGKEKGGEIWDCARPPRLARMAGGDCGFGNLGIEEF